MNAVLCLLAAFAQPAKPERPEPFLLAGDVLPAGAVTRLGPQAFRYAGWGGTPAYSPDGKRVAVTSGTGVYVWESASGKRLLWLASGGSGVIAFLGFTAGGEVVVSCRRKWDDGGAGAFRADPDTGRITAK